MGDRVDDYLARANVRGIRIPPFLREDQEHFVENVNSIVPGYGADIANDINVQLLNKDQLLLKAVGTVFPGAGNVIIAVTYYKILMHLEKTMSMWGLHMVNHKHEYARILLHLKEALEVLPIENPHCSDNFLDPLDYDECIRELKKDMLRSIRRRRSDAVVYVCKETGPYRAFLQSLADHLMQ